MSARIALVTGAGSGIRARSRARPSEIRIFGSPYGQASGAARCHCCHGRQRRRRMLAVPTDVSQPDEVRRLFASTRETFGRLDLLFNNAGTGAPAIPMEDLTTSSGTPWSDVNLTGAFLCAQEAIRMMKAQDPRGGRIINNGSISAHAPRPHSAPYTATKHAITGLTKSHLARRPAVRYRLRPDRYRQCRYRDDRAMTAGVSCRRTARWRSSRAWTCSTSPTPCSTWRICRSTPTFSS